jgi:hypothetical protein
VETEVADPVSDESDDNEVAADVDNPMDDAEDFEAVEKSEITEDAETSDVAETEKAEETLAEETSAEDVEEPSIEEPVSYGKSFSSEQSEKSWREISTNGLVVTAIDSL